MMKRSFRCILALAIGTLLTPATLAAENKDISGNWYCQYHDSANGISHYYYYNIPENGLSVMTGNFILDGGTGVMNIQFSAEIDVQVTGNEFWEYTRSVDILSLTFDGEDTADEFKADMKAELLKAPESASSILHISEQELVYTEDGLVAGCTPRTEQ